nr:tetratricopeptide repeat protein [Ktedonobacteraceae bacterium]
MRPEWLIPLISEQVFAYMVDRDGTEEHPQSAFVRDSMKAAFRRAVGKAFQQFEQRHPQWVPFLFDADFLGKQGAPILAQLLLPGGHPDPAEFARRLANSLPIHLSDDPLLGIRTLEAVAADFLASLDDALKAEASLGEQQSSRDLKEITSSVQIGAHAKALSVIRIEERPKGGEGWNALVRFEDGFEYPITIKSPFSGQDEERLEWYFEQYLCFPFTRQIEAREAAASITAYGEALFRQVFSNRRVYTEYLHIRDEGQSSLQIEIAGSPAFHALHWEALKDPDIPLPLVLQATMVRKNIAPQVMPEAVRPSPTINVLLVTARPSGKQDVGYRTISRPLLEVLRQAQLPVQVDILRPGTYRALAEHLRNVSSQNGDGHYHIIHFDVHGSILTYEQLQGGQDANKLLYQAHRYGREDRGPFEGGKAFLFLEGERDDHADAVDATEIAHLLLGHRIPIAILNACQSGKQIGASETSIGSRLMHAGVQLVLAMGYSITVSAAMLLMQTLYEQLFANQDLPKAIRQARLELYNHKERLAYFNQTIELEDWLLPVVYQSREQRLTVRAFTPEEARTYYERQAAHYAPPQPAYGFVGRDLDILQIEKRLLARRNVLLIRGMGGTGKTTLLQHLGSWWQSTGFVAQVIYFGFDERAWTRQQLLASIASRLLAPRQYVRDFQPLSLDAQQAILTQRLRAERHLLVLDNLESVTGTQLAIQHTLPPEEQVALRHLLANLVGASTLILLGSRGSEDWLAEETFGDNVYELGGLDPEAASLLANHILERYEATHYRMDVNLHDLLLLLDGFPLALEVVLANLAHQPPKEVLMALQAGDSTLDVGDSEQRTENILHCIDYSHSNLSSEAQDLLLCLAPFTSIIYRNTLNQYVALLEQQPTLATLPFDRWEEVLREAENWGLVSPDRGIPAFLRLQPILPYFLRSRLHDSARIEMRRAVEAAFRQYYDQVGSELLNLLFSKDSQERQLGLIVSQLEYENLVSALHLALAFQVSIYAPYFALSAYLDAIQDQRRGLKLGEEVLVGLEAYPVDIRSGRWSIEYARIIGDMANQHLGLRQHAEAKTLYHKLLQIVPQLVAGERRGQQGLDSEISHQQAGPKLHVEGDQREYHELEVSAYHQLGIIAQEWREYEQAEHYYQQALQLSIEYADRYAQARTYHQLGIIAQEQHKWEQAEYYYQQALQSKSEENDRYAQASTYHQLGNVALQQGQYEQAEHYYQQALQLSIEYADRYAQARTYGQLGNVARQQGQWEQAEHYYQQALQITIEYNDRYTQAGTYHNLGIIAQEQREYEQAEHYYQQALQLSVEYADRYAQASTYHQLGNVAFQ